MNELITISYEKEIPTVSGRDLHAALEIGTEYAKWFERMCLYGFIEGKSYSSILTNRSDGQPGKPKIDHAITIQMAKELCMLQRTDKGKRFREYFIRAEEAWNDPNKIMERALQIARQRALEAERKIMGLAERNETLETELNISNSYCTVAKYNTMHSKNWDIHQCQFIGKGLSMFCREHSIPIRRCSTNDERFGAVNSYPLEAWERFMRLHPYF
jgi:phage anti-repressor protein